MNRIRDEHPENKPKTLIGWREYVALPEFGVEHIKAKADTGARTGAIDVSDLEELPGDRVRFHLVVDRAHPEHRVEVTTAIARRTRVKSSFGAAHDRLLIRTTLRLGPIEKAVELGLVSRKNMLCRMLLGRAALEPEFIVDPARRYLFGLGPRKKRRKKKKKSTTGGIRAAGKREKS